MRGKEASSDTSAEGIRLLGAGLGGLGTPPCCTDRGPGTEHRPCRHPGPSPGLESPELGCGHPPGTAGEAAPCSALSQEKGSGLEEGGTGQTRSPKAWRNPKNPKQKNEREGGGALGKKRKSGDQELQSGGAWRGGGHGTAGSGPVPPGALVPRPV